MTCVGRTGNARWRTAPLPVLLLLAGCEAGRSDDNASQPVAEPPANAAAAPSPLPIVRSLDREALLLAVARAASAHAAGQDASAAQAELDGLRFEVAIRAGCGIGASPASSVPGAEDGPRPASAERPGTKAAAPAEPEPSRTSPSAGADGSLSFAYDGEDGRLRFRAVPDATLASPEVARSAGDAFEAVEGFWLPSPWLFSPACPPDGAGGVPPERSVAIARFYTAEDGRTQRRADRAYETIATISREDLPPGFDFVLSGRLRKPAGRPVIGCAAASPGARPSCIVSAEIDEVRLERADSGEVLASWRQA